MSCELGWARTSRGSEDDQPSPVVLDEPAHLVGLCRMV